jgi:hypothetical protein
MNDTARVWDVRTGKTLAVLPSSPIPADLQSYGSTFSLTPEERRTYLRE